MEQIFKKRVVPVAVIDRLDDAVPLAEALMAGGLEVIEVTFRTPAAEAAIRNITKALPSMLVGAGTILEVEQVKRAKDAGARFAVAPGINEKVVTASLGMGLPFIPGRHDAVGSRARAGAGVQTAEVLPGRTCRWRGDGEILCRPYGHTGVKFIPLGGVGPKNAAEYLALPIVAAIGGSWLCDRKLVAEKKWSAITALTAEAVRIAGSVNP